MQNILQLYRIAFLPDKIGKISFWSEIRRQNNSQQPFVMKAGQEIIQAGITAKPNISFTPLAIMGGIGTIAMTA